MFRYLGRNINLDMLNQVVLNSYIFVLFMWYVVLFDFLVN